MPGDVPGPAAGRPHVAVGTVIVGSGFAGLGMAIALRRAGQADFVVLERANAVGGTWRDNDYPGCACDIEAELYAFSFARNTFATRRYPAAAEILAYLRACAKRYGIEPRIRFGCDVIDAAYDDATARWFVATDGGPTYVANALVLGVGGLSKPAVPNIAGADGFRGPQFHSARWDHGVDLRDARVAVVGTGASAIQFVPEIAPRVRELTLYQRTPAWILPRGDRPIDPRTSPPLAAARRALTYWRHEASALGFTRWPRLLTLAERLATRHLRASVRDPELRAKLRPAYRLGCKRALLSDAFYPALQRSNVTLVTAPIERIEADAIVTRDGVRRPADAIVYGTGFRATDGLAPMRVAGANGVTLDDAWRAGMTAFLGTSVAGFPNLFLLVGPNTGLGHNSMVYMIESQIAYVLDALRTLRRRRAASLDVRAEVAAAFEREIARRMTTTVWSTGCTSWYLDRAGRNTTLWPGFTFEFRRRTRRVDARRYDWTPAVRR